MTQPAPSQLMHTTRRHGLRFGNDGKIKRWMRCQCSVPVLVRVQLLSVAVVVTLAGAFSLGYRAGYARASKPTVVFARDVADGRPSGSAKQGHEPYFTRGNPVTGDLK